MFLAIWFKTYIVKYVIFKYLCKCKYRSGPTYVQQMYHYRGLWHVKLSDVAHVMNILYKYENLLLVM